MRVHPAAGVLDAEVTACAGSSSDISHVLYLSQRGLGIRRVKLRFAYEDLTKPPRAVATFGAPTGSTHPDLPAEASICLKHPGFDVDVIVTADIKALYQVWLGRVRLEDAMRSNQVRLDGAPSDVQAFPAWFGRSRMAETVRAAMADSGDPRERLASLSLGSTHRR
jgi:hypothetical protein